MTPEALLHELLECGIEPEVTPDGKAIAVPAGRLTAAQRTAVLTHKVELIERLLESSDLTARLLRAAMHRCDQFNDSDKAREEMRQDVLATPPHLRQDLLEHLMETQKKESQ